MYEGFQMKQEHEEMLHLETLRLLRYNAFTVYCSIPTKKKKVSLQNFYPLPKDRKKAEITGEQMIAFFERKDPVISNGKLRGYKDKNGNFEMIN